MLRRDDAAIVEEVGVATTWYHDRQRVLERMRYWHEPLVEQPTSQQYLTFWPDCGGFNNIRMGFEFAVLLAFVTRRTLVLPTPQPWYLIDFGPLTRMKPTPGAPWEGPTTSFSQFFNLSALRAQVPVISASQFLLRERTQFKGAFDELAPLLDTVRRQRSRPAEANASARPLQLGPSVTWRSARAACRGLTPAMRLCTFEELCPVTAGGERTPRVWLEEAHLGGDHWTPVVGERRRSLGEERRRVVREWVEVGDSAGRQVWNAPPPRLHQACPPPPTALCPPRSSPVNVSASSTRSTGCPRRGRTTSRPASRATSSAAPAVPRPLTRPARAARAVAAAAASPVRRRWRRHCSGRGATFGRGSPRQLAQRCLGHLSRGMSRGRTWRPSKGRVAAAARPNCRLRSVGGARSSTRRAL